MRRLTPEQKADIDVVEDFFCGPGNRDNKQTKASAAVRDLIQDFGHDNGAKIIADRVHARMLRKIRTGGGPRHEVSLTLMNRGYHAVKKRFLSALYRRLVRNLVKIPYFQFIKRISSPWIYARSALTDADVAGIHEDTGRGAGMDVLTPMQEAKLKKYTNILTSDQELGDLMVNEVLAGRDIYGLAHPDLEVEVEDAEERSEVEVNEVRRRRTIAKHIRKSINKRPAKRAREEDEQEASSPSPVKKSNFIDLVDDDDDDDDDS